VRAVCPICGKSGFRYTTLLNAWPGREWSPQVICCPDCGAELRLTTRARWAAVLLMFVPAGALILWRPGTTIFMGALALAWAISFFIAWPRIVSFQKWSPFKVWLPKGRIVGYTVYLLLPLVIMFGLLWLGAMNGWGM
jgi:hypothetical protein